MKKWLIVAKQLAAARPLVAAAIGVVATLAAALGAQQVADALHGVLLLLGHSAS